MDSDQLSANLDLQFIKEGIDLKISYMHTAPIRLKIGSTVTQW